jgi:predicted phosphodiesterase
MSDTHDTHHKINIQDMPKGDIFIHSGDFTKRSAPDYKHKIVIAGNHDFTLDKAYVAVKQNKGELVKVNT